MEILTTELLNYQTVHVTPVIHQPVNHERCELVSMWRLAFSIATPHYYICKSGLMLNHLFFTRRSILLIFSVSVSES